VIFNTWIYGLFLLVAFCLYWMARARWRPWILTACGCVFYGFYYPPHLILILVMTLTVYALGWVVGSRRMQDRGLWFGFGVAGCLGLLAYYKYEGFFFESLALVFPAAGHLPAAEAPLRAPLAISFFTFEYVHYLIEIYRGSFAPAGLRDFGLFIMFFPTLICGPIKRFQQFNPQEYAQRSLDPRNVNSGLQRILFGLAKKTLVADMVAPFCAPVFAHPAAYTWVQLWLALYGYAMQIYFDFSGYSDIAIGSAKLFGYTVQENFNYPYLQPDIARFWRCWHISLTSWITDYLYIPLGGNRHGETRAYVNRFLSMTLCGLWHGAAFHFMAWGMYHGIGLNLYRAYQVARARWGWPRTTSPHVALRVLSALVTFHFVCIGWVLFVCDLNTAWAIILRLLWLRA
jgi:alginate O-acetyltransferase complex protein AlgI